MKRMETRLGSRKEDLSETSFFDVSTDDKLLQNIHMLKLGVFDVVVIFTAGNAGRLEELKKR
ncbi:hypothetical protein V1478_000178 [Vespula squamosa]|uniref:Uncharacterized protein n=1 Tax=Vespula squamosa TaxID=30214 RepID=A0ABD2C8W6_VESSQ